MINILWDSSHLWGLLAFNALTATGCPCRLLKAEKIAQGGLSGKVLLVPGGSAKGKMQALGEKGRNAIRDFVAQGGHYMGMCGGAGMALADGLGLCLWKRADMGDRLQHLISGHLQCSLSPSALIPADLDQALLPVWWPARFAEAEQALPGGPEVLARYTGAGADLYVGDMPYRAMPEQVRAEWQSLYGLNLRPTLLDQEPCIIHGRFGQGDYLLSYSHLESPGLENSPVSDASRIFFHILGLWRNEDLSLLQVKEWQPNQATVYWAEPDLLDARQDMQKLLELGEELGLFFPRRPWLHGWKNGVPGAQLNSLNLAISSLLNLPPTASSMTRWNELRNHFMAQFRLFIQGTRSWLLARRLAESLAESHPDILPKALLKDQRLSLFGSPMQQGGLCGSLQDMLEDVLVSAWH